MKSVAVTQRERKATAALHCFHFGKDNVWVLNTKPHPGVL